MVFVEKLVLLGYNRIRSSAFSVHPI